MKETLKAGLESTAKFEVDRERTIGFMGEQARVYATPMLVRDIEVACRNLLLAHVDDGEDSVGTQGELEHVAQTLTDRRVELHVTIVDVKGRAVTFEIEGRDSVEPICRGRHVRFVVDVAKTRARLAAKAGKAIA